VVSTDDDARRATSDADGSVHADGSDHPEARDTVRADAPIVAASAQPEARSRRSEIYHTRPEPVVEADGDGVLVDDLLHLLDRAPAPRWARLRVAVRTRIPPSRLQLGNRFTREERALIRYAVGRVLVMEVP
jgi:hypothetical protein